MVDTQHAIVNVEQESILETLSMIFVESLWQCFVDTLLTLEMSHASIALRVMLRSATTLLTPYYATWRREGNRIATKVNPRLINFNNSVRMGSHRTLPRPCPAWQVYPLQLNPQTTTGQTRWECCVHTHVLK